MFADTDEVILVIGADGTIGRSLVTSLETKGKTVWQTTRHQSQVSERRLFLDLSEDENKWNFPSIQFSTVVFCAAITSIEYCRIEPDLSRQVNVVSTVKLAKRFFNNGAYIIFLSTSAVFDGKSPLVRPGEHLNPQSNYGEQKAEAEKQLLCLGDKVAIVRLGKVITTNVSLLMSWVINLKSGEKIHPFYDMVMAPVSIALVIKLLIQLAEKKVPGIFQLSANNDISYAKAAEYIAEKLGVDAKVIEPISYKDRGIIFSPIYATFDCSMLLEFGLSAPLPTTALDDFLFNI